MQTRTQQQAKSVLAQCRVRRAPVPVRRIARLLGIVVKAEPVEDDLSGALVREGGQAVIGVNSLHHKNRQRFTIAHELGHFRLHDSVPFHMDDDFRRVDFRAKSNPHVSAQDEIEANQFAAELLMPEDFLRADLDKKRGPSEPNVEALAKRYAVSRQAMEIRLRNLGYLPPVDNW